MSIPDDEFLKTLLAAFQVEAQEHLQVMSAGLLELEKAPAASPTPDLLEDVYREAHSLKGAARAVSQPHIESLCQAMETVFAAWKRQAIQPLPADFDTLHRATDLIQQLVDVPGGIEPARLAQMVAGIEQLGSDSFRPPHRRNRSLLNRSCRQPSGRTRSGSRRASWTA